jgi:hypothetical protein
MAWRRDVGKEEFPRDADWAWKVGETGQSEKLSAVFIMIYKSENSSAARIGKCLYSTSLTNFSLFGIIRVPISLVCSTRN